MDTITKSGTHYKDDAKTKSDKGKKHREASSALEQHLKEAKHPLVNPWTQPQTRDDQRVVVEYNARQVYPPGHTHLVVKPKKGQSHHFHVGLLEPNSFVCTLAHQEKPGDAKFWVAQVKSVKTDYNFKGHWFELVQGSTDKYKPCKRRGKPYSATIENRTIIVRNATLENGYLDEATVKILKEGTLS
jgi:hypothetical protein